MSTVQNEIESPQDIFLKARQVRARYGADMRAYNCSSRKSNAGARLAITVFESRVLESVGTILPKLFLSLARQ
jgi:hypothetical protein